MKTITTHLLCTAAVATTSSRCSAYVAVPSSFGITLNNARQAHVLAGRPCDLRFKEKKEYSTIGTRRSSTCIYSVPYAPSMEEEGDDGSFFLSASQQAAKDRYELLKQGKDPLAMSLSTTSVKEEQQEKKQLDIDEKEEVAVVSDVSSDSTDNSSADAAPSISLENDDYNDLLSSLSESPMAQSLEEEKVESPTSTLDEIKRVEDEIAEVKAQIKEKVQKRQIDTREALHDAERLGEGSTAEEMEAARNARLAAAGQVIKSDEKIEEDEAAAAVSTSTDSSSKIHAGEGSTAEEMEEAREARLAAADEIANELKKTESAVATAPTEEEEKDEIKADPGEDTLPVSSAAPSEPKSDEEPSNANQPKLSSDGKEIYEPSQAVLDINQENVDNGLMVLTRSFLVLNSIVQRLDEGKK